MSAAILRINGYW